MSDGLTDARHRALLDVRDGFLLQAERLYSAPWLQARGLIQPAPHHDCADPVAKRAFVLTDAGRAVLEAGEDK